MSDTHEVHTDDCPLSSVDDCAMIDATVLDISKHDGVSACVSARQLRAIRRAEVIAMAEVKAKLGLLHAISSPSPSPTQTPTLDKPTTKPGPNACSCCNRDLVTPAALLRHRFRCCLLIEVGQCTTCNTTRMTQNEALLHGALCLNAFQKEEAISMAQFQHVRDTFQESELNRTQQHGLHFVNAKVLSDTAKSVLLVRLLSQGYDAVDLELLCRYVREKAPISIHVDTNRKVYDHGNMKLWSDTHYRNQFETNSSNGSLNPSARKNVEKRMFGHAHSLSPFERVKYGTLNGTRSANGVARAQAYGESFLSFKTSVRPRVTICAGDSLDCTRATGTLDHCCHVFMEMDDEELQNIVNIARGQHVSQSSFAHRRYIELQFHGELQLHRDVQYVALGVLTNYEVMRKFQQRTNVPLLTIQGESLIP